MSSKDKVLNLDDLAIRIDEKDLNKIIETIRGRSSRAEVEDFVYGIMSESKDLTETFKIASIDNFWEIYNMRNIDDRRYLEGLVGFKQRQAFYLTCDFELGSKTRSYWLNSIHDFLKRFFQLEFGKLNPKIYISEGLSSLRTDKYEDITKITGIDVSTYRYLVSQLSSSETNFDEFDPETFDPQRTRDIARLINFTIEELRKKIRLTIIVRNIGYVNQMACLKIIARKLNDDFYKQYNKIGIFNIHDYPAFNEIKYISIIYSQDTSNFVVSPTYYPLDNNWNPIEIIDLINRDPNEWKNYFIQYVNISEPGLDMVRYIRDNSDITHYLSDVNLTDEIQKEDDLMCCYRSIKTENLDDIIDKISNKCDVEKNVKVLSELIKEQMNQDYSMNAEGKRCTQCCINRFRIMNIDHIYDNIDIYNYVIDRYSINIQSYLYTLTNFDELKKSRLMNKFLDLMTLGDIFNLSESREYIPIEKIDGQERMIRWFLQKWSSDVSLDDKPFSDIKHSFVNVLNSYLDITMAGKRRGKKTKVITKYQFKVINPVLIEVYHKYFDPFPQ
jgi:hypothetical protein